MVEKTTNLDDHRGMMAQRATELRRLRAEVEADQAALRARQLKLETLLAAAPASDWAEAVEKARAENERLGDLIAALEARIVSLEAQQQRLR